MSDDSHPSHSPSTATADETGRMSVLAHSMLGTATAIRGAIDMAMVDGIDDEGQALMLSIAVKHLDSLTGLLRSLAAGVTGVGDDTSEDDLRPGGRDYALEAGTRVELFSAFNHTWTAGFAIAGVTNLGYRVRRITDGSLLPGHTSPSDLRVHKQRGGFAE